ncbi:MAG: hypothetical protein ABSE48_08440 [Verrucomicrobiota bacterium]
MKINRKLTRTVVCLAIGVSMLTLADIPVSASDSNSGSEQTYSGTVKEVNLNEHTFKVEGSMMLSKKFDMGATCTYSFLGNPHGTSEGLHAGQQVKVSYQTADGELAADRVEQQSLTYTGYVKAVDSKARTITVASGGFSMSKQFKFIDGCKVSLRGEKTGTFDDIQVGNYVTLTYETPSGLPTIQRISQSGEQFTGSLTAIDLDEKTLKAKSMFDSKSFHVGAHCVIVTKGKAGGKLSDLKPEDKLVFTFDQIDGVNVVNRIAPAK